MSSEFSASLTFKLNKRNEKCLISGSYLVSRLTLVNNKIIGKFSALSPFLNHDNDMKYVILKM